MIAGDTLEKLVQDGHLVVLSQVDNAPIKDIRSRKQPNSLEVGTLDILRADGRPVEKDASGWILAPDVEYFALPDVSFKMGDNLPEFWSPAHALIQEDGIVRPFQQAMYDVLIEKVYDDSRKKIIDLSFLHRIDMLNLNAQGKGNHHYHEESDTSLRASDTSIRSILELDERHKGRTTYGPSGRVTAYFPGEYYIPDRLRLKAFAYPRSGVQRRGIQVSYNTPSLAQGEIVPDFDPTLYRSKHEEVPRSPLDFILKLKCHFRTHVPFGYALIHVAFDANFGRKTFFSEKAVDRFSQGDMQQGVYVKRAERTMMTRYGLLLTCDVDTCQRFRKNSEMMPLGGKVEASDFYESVRLEELRPTDVFAIASREKIAIGDQVVGIACGDAILALRSTERATYRNGDAIIPGGVNWSENPLQVYQGGMLPMKSAVDVTCLGGTTGIIDSGLGIQGGKLVPSTLTTVHIPRPRLLTEWWDVFMRGELPMLYVALEGLDKPVKVRYGDAGNTYQSVAERVAV